MRNTNPSGAAIAGGDAAQESVLDTTVARRDQLADGVVRIALQRADGADFPAWQPGAHIDLVLEPDLVRQYSLCGDPQDRSTLEVAVLREPCSRGGSSYVHEKLAPGDSVRIRGPRNHFPLVEADGYLFIAGGIGITPILPMIEQVAQSGTPWRLLYGGRSRTSMPFLTDLIERYGEPVDIRAQDETGLLDLDTALGTPRERMAVYCCGPEGLLQAVEQRCQRWPAGALHVERFAPRAVDPTAATASFQLELARTGRTLTVPADRSIVDVLDDAGITVPVSCREGTCGTCETAVLAGTPEHRDSILTEQERDANDVMFVCVSRSRSDVLRIDR